MGLWDINGDFEVSGRSQSDKLLLLLVKDGYKEIMIYSKRGGGEARHYFPYKVSND